MFEEYLNETKEFRYHLLDRLIQDCKYYLGMGHRKEKFLHQRDVKNQIALMRALYFSFDVGEKPEWITLDEITEFENRMLD